MTFDIRAFLDRKPAAVFHSNKEGIRRALTEITGVENFFVYPSAVRSSRRSKVGMMVRQKWSKTTLFPSIIIGQINGLPQPKRTLMDLEFVEEFWPFYIVINHNWEHHIVGLIAKLEVGPACMFSEAIRVETENSDGVKLVNRVYLKTEADTILMQMYYEMTAKGL